MANKYYKALQIARFLIKKSTEETDQKNKLTNLKLQKILYYAQGWYLANFSKALFTDRIEAWKLGPAISSVYQAYKSYGSKVIDETITDDKINIEEVDKSFLIDLWNIYKKYSGADLVYATHNETPWIYARQDINERYSSDLEITLDSMETYFKGLLRNGQST